MEGRDVEYYLSKGFDRRMAEYYARGKKILTDAEPFDDYMLLLTYDHSEKRFFDMKELIQQGTVFSFLRDKANFNRVYVDDTHSLCWDIDPNIDSRKVWSNKVDLCPDSCYVDSTEAMV